MRKYPWDGALCSQTSFLPQIRKQPLDCAVSHSIDGSQIKALDQKRRPGNSLCMRNLSTCQSFHSASQRQVVQRARAADQAAAYNIPRISSWFCLLSICQKYDDDSQHSPHLSICLSIYLLPLPPPISTPPPQTPGGSPLSPLLPPLLSAAPKRAASTHSS